MGQLVFQATLGGQVNLIGTNTASTFNINVPATSGNMVTTGDTGTVTTTMLASTTGSGAVVLATSPTLVTPALGTPSALVGTNITGTAAGLSIGGNAATATTATNVSGGTSSVTSETVSGNLTLSDGTANGVAYLNGSKVVTTGSALVFDGSNFGLGVTPSAFGVLGPVYQVGISSLSGYGSQILLSNNYYYSSGEKRISAGYATQYVQSNSGQHVWYIAPTAAANTAITFTQAMMLDASGNLGVGTTSPSQRLEVSGGDAKITAAANGTRNLFFGTSATNYQTIKYNDNDGSLTIGSISSAYPVIFQTQGSERARIDSSGNLLVGQTTHGFVNANSFEISPPNGGYTISNHVSGSTSGTAYAYFAYNAGVIGSITQSGTTAVLYNITSDQRLKENIVDAPEFGSVIDSMQVRSYDWKSDGNHQRAGFIAQELVTVAPEAVHQPADPEEMMAVDYSKLVPMLVKEIQSLRARVAQLESK